MRHGGKLFDRDGRLIVDNYPSVSCFLVREQGHDYEADLPLIARGLHMTVEQIHAILKKYRADPKYEPLPLKKDITPDEQEFIEAHRDEMPELETVDEQRRLYPKDGFAAHLIGYVGEVSEDMLNDPRYAYYEPGDVVGRSGVEESYDALLRGQDGSRDVLVDSHGREVGQAGNRALEGGPESEADHRSRYPAGGGECIWRSERCSDRHGSAYRGDAGDGEPACFRSECSSPCASGAKSGTS